MLDLPTLPGTAHHPHLQGGAPVSEFLALEAGERVLALTTLDTDSPGLALGTRQGVVKRVNPEVLGNRDAWEVIRLADGDEVVGAVELRTGDEELCFVTSDAQLLHFARRRRCARRVAPAAASPASGWRPKQSVVSFGALRPRRLARSW